MNSRVYGMITPSDSRLPSSHDGAMTFDVLLRRSSSWPPAAGAARTPNVTSSVSSGRSYIRRRSSHSISTRRARRPRRPPGAPACRPGGGPREEGHLRLQHVRRVGADHDQLAVRHVDDAHLAERERQAEGDEEQDRPRLSPLKTCSRNVSIGRSCSDRTVSLSHAGQALGPVVVVEARDRARSGRRRPRPRRSGRRR